MLRIALLVLALVGVASPEHADVREVRRGPPLLCWPIQIGSATSLAWGGDGASRPSESRSSPAALVTEAARILNTSDDALVHMETLRRAYLCLLPEQPVALQSSRLAGGHQLLALLKDAALIASAPGPRGAPPNARREALAWFDLGYFLAADTNSANTFGDGGSLPPQRILERAANGAPGDAALRFGVGFGQYGCMRFDEDTGDGWYARYWRTQADAHVLAAMDLTTDRESLVAKNICSVYGGMGCFGPPTTFEALRARVGARAGSRPGDGDGSAPRRVYRNDRDIDDDKQPLDPDVVALVSEFGMDEQFQFELHRDGTVFVSGPLSATLSRVMPDDPRLTKKLGPATVERVVDAFIAHRIADMRRWCDSETHLTCGAAIRLILNARGIEKRVYAYSHDASARPAVELIGDLKKLLPIDAWTVEQSAAVSAWLERSRAEPAAATTRPESRAGK